MRGAYKEHEAELRRLIEVEKLTQVEVARRFGVDRTTVERWCRRFDLETQRTGPRRGHLHTGWKGGVVIRKGYRYIYSPDHPYRTKQRYVSEHRLVMEAKLKRYLHPKEVVHHIDGNPLNNVPENLMVFGSNAEHLKHELTGKVPKWTPEGKARMGGRGRKQTATPGS